MFYKIIFVLLFFLCSSLSLANPLKLSGPLAQGGKILNHQVSPDSKRVVFIADKDTDETFELYSVPITGNTPPIKLSGSMVLGGSVSTSSASFQITSDSQRVVFTADKDTDDVVELYSVPIIGGTAPIKLNDPLPSGRNVSKNFQISSDNQRVVFAADKDTDDVVELYSVPIIGGTAPVKLGGPLASTEGFFPFSTSFQISSDSQQVVFIVDNTKNDDVELYSIPILGGTPPIKLGGPLLPDGRFSLSRKPFQISSDSQRVVFAADINMDNFVELYSIPIIGGTPPD